MEIIAYGEDSLTLWALQNKFECILEPFKDNTSKSDCIIFYRPSFGRSGGENRSEFGEFDFIILSSEKIYLGETKWWCSPEHKKGNKVIHLKDNQVCRHKVFKQYLKQLFEYKQRENWVQFFDYVVDKLSKPIPSINSKLRKNLIYILDIIANRYVVEPPPDIVDVLLYISKEKYVEKENDQNFKVVSLTFEGKLYIDFVGITI